MTSEKTCTFAGAQPRWVAVGCWKREKGDWPTDTDMNEVPLTSRRKLKELGPIMSHFAAGESPHYFFQQRIFALYVTNTAVVRLRLRSVGFHGEVDFVYERWTSRIWCCCCCCCCYCCSWWWCLRWGSRSTSMRAIIPAIFTRQKAVTASKGIHTISIKSHAG